ncbi:hypothetical protein QVD17_34664 [Tagetes erecta]|uniref:Uncharacterized protein n=1 Tax=Tagetes erecta TaxID=13708 RepID=A0AAD8NEM1_TARER|nr:hypothetical protein QVD17_34664 [Tagetes erecta]
MSFESKFTNLHVFLYETMFLCSFISDLYIVKNSLLKQLTEKEFTILFCGTACWTGQQQAAHVSEVGWREEDDGDDISGGGGVVEEVVEPNPTLSKAHLNDKCKSVRFFHLIFTFVSPSDLINTFTLN